MKSLTVEIWSDVVCPWCYIGKRRFESALARFAHRDQIAITWRSYQLDPDAPQAAAESLEEHLAKKLGVSLAQAAALNDRVSVLATKEGLDYHFEKARYGNTFDAHRLVHLAATHHLQDEMEERLFYAYFTEGAALGESDTLVKLASEVGLDADEVRNMLSSDAYADEVRADIRRARRLGVQGVPFFAVDEKYGVSGAQPADLFLEVLERAWGEAQPLINVTSTAQTEAASCDEDTCRLDQTAASE